MPFVSCLKIDRRRFGIENLSPRGSQKAGDCVWYVQRLPRGVFYYNACRFRLSGVDAGASVLPCCPLSAWCVVPVGMTSVTFTINCAVLPHASAKPSHRLNILVSLRFKWFRLQLKMKLLSSLATIYSEAIPVRNMLHKHSPTKLWCISTELRVEVVRKNWRKGQWMSGAGALTKVDDCSWNAPWPLLLLCKDRSIQDSRMFGYCLEQSCELMSAVVPRRLCNGTENTIAGCRAE